MFWRKKIRPPDSAPLHQQTLVLMLTSLALVMLPHMANLPLWVVPTTMLLLVWRYWITRNNLSLPARWQLVGLVTIGMAGIMLSLHTLAGRDAGLALLTLMTGLKLMEMRTRRDQMLVVYLGYFLVITNFLYTQTIPTAVLMFPIVILMTMTLVEITRPDGFTSHRKNLRLALTLMAQAIPVMLILFVLFPRVSGPLWGLPKDAHKGMTGLSDKMAPGEISNLSQSSAIAFRVNFIGEAPPPSQRYWRGPIFYATDGRTWSKGYGRIMPDRSPTTDAFLTADQAIEYRIALEPHNQRWLFTLDLPDPEIPYGRITPDYQWLHSKPIHQRISYNHRSYTRYNTGAIADFQRDLALQLPANISQRMTDLVDMWRRDGAGSIAVVNAALRHFREQPFVYTLTPPLLTRNPVDQFLFETQRGFCEHYASAFTTLMRMAGIPARIVTGYQGGEYNELGDYYIVRQSDAHAWSEVWLAESGWIRVDPTAAVAPSRIEMSIINDPGSIGDAIRFRIPGDSFVAAQWLKMRHLWDNIDYQWNNWVLAYGPEKQMELLASLGFKDISWRGLAIGLVSMVTLLLISVGVWQYLISKKRLEPCQAIYEKFQRRLQRKGIKIYRHEGPLDFYRRVALIHPEWAAEMYAITDQYMALRYGSIMEAGGLKQLQRAVSAFHP